MAEGFIEPRRTQSWKDLIMLYTFAMILLILWLLRLVSGYTIGASSMSS
jgi:hypothetical protein